MTDEIQVGWGGKSLKARGDIVVTLVLAAIVVVSVTWLQLSHNAATAKDHSDIAKEIRAQTLEQRKGNCINSLSEADKLAMRETIRRGTLPVDAFKIYCPWMEWASTDNRREYPR